MAPLALRSPRHCWCSTLDSPHVLGTRVELETLRAGRGLFLQDLALEDVGRIPLGTVGGDRPLDDEGMNFTISLNFQH